MIMASISGQDMLKNIGLEPYYIEKARFVDIVKIAVINQ